MGEKYFLSKISVEYERNAYLASFFTCYRSVPGVYFSSLLIDASTLAEENIQRFGSFEKRKRFICAVHMCAHRNTE